MEVHLLPFIYEKFELQAACNLSDFVIFNATEILYKLEAGAKLCACDSYQSFTSLRSGSKVQDCIVDSEQHLWGALLVIN